MYNVHVEVHVYVHVHVHVYMYEVEDMCVAVVKDLQYKTPEVLNVKGNSYTCRLGL